MDTDTKWEFQITIGPKPPNTPKKLYLGKFFAWHPPLQVRVLCLYLITFYVQFELKLPSTPPIYQATIQTNYPNHPKGRKH